MITGSNSLDLLVKLDKVIELLTLVLDKLPEPKKPKKGKK